MRRPRLRRLFHLDRFGRRLKGSLDEEVSFHLETRIEQLVAAGKSPEEAREEVLRQFGDPELVLERCRRIDQGGLRRRLARDLFSDLLQDVRYTLRGLRRARGFALVAILSLAVGIGVNTAVFTTIQAVWFDPVPGIADPERIVDMVPVIGGEDYWNWAYPDFVVQATDFYGLDLIVRLDHPPEWALRAEEDEADSHATPFDADAYLRFVDAVARRYQGRIQGYIIWNEPNLAQEWGAAPDPVAYKRLLQRAYAVVKQNDPFALVISAGLAPTNTSTGTEEQDEGAIDDRLFLEKMYQAGARPFFDALGAHPYGFAYSPDDPPGAHAGFNMNRILDLRATMEAYGDVSKPVWATEVGWTTQGLGEHAWLTVSAEEQADYLVRAWRKTQVGYPWIDAFTVWNLSQGLPDRDEKAGYSLLYKDGRPKPACEALREAFSLEDPEPSTRGLLKMLDLLFPAASSVPILARDAEVHLGDSE